MVASGRKKSALKRSRIQEVVGSAMDRISDLPEAVLLHILSFLPAIYIVRTSILSRRWQNVWTCVPCLDFDYRHEGFKYKKDFVNFVNTFLLQYKGGSIKKFRMECNSLLSKRAAWVRWAIDRNVEELDLGFAHVSLHLPKTLFGCKSLVTLKLKSHDVSMTFPPSACIPCLKTLELESVGTTDDEFENKLISCCVVLENLYIQRGIYDKVKSLRVHARHLKCLKIKFHASCYQKKECVIDINTPTLKDLEIRNGGSYHLLLANIGTCRTAKISLDESKAFQSLLKCFPALNNVKSLWLSSFYTGQACKWEPGLTVYNVNLTHLTLGVRSVWVRLLPHFFHCFPNLEVVRLTKSGRTYVGGKPCIDPELVPTSLLSSLRVFDAEEFRGTEDELDMLQYILKNGKVLDLVQIQYLSSSQIANEYTTRKVAKARKLMESAACEEKLRVAQKILSFPRASHKCEIKFL